jgi:hypothetical protein
MDIHIHPYIIVLVFIIGLVLIFAGIALGKPGASIIGLIVAAVNLQQLLKINRKQGVNE